MEKAFNLISASTVKLAIGDFIAKPGDVEINWPESFEKQKPNYIRILHHFHIN